jgi:agmatinase
VSPLAGQQVADAGDIACNPFDITEAMAQVEAAAADLLAGAGHLLAIGGDHTIAYPLLRATSQRFGPPALVHFDAHLDTWQTYFGAPLTHGTPFRRAAEEGLFAEQHSMHVGIRGPLYARGDLDEDAELGFRIVHAMEIERIGIDGVVARIRERVGDAPAPPRRAASPPGNCSASCAAWPASRWPAPTWSRLPRPTTTPRSPRWRPHTCASNCSR